MNKVSVIELRGNQYLRCDCGAQCRQGSNKSLRFIARHPKLCSERKDFTKQLAQGVRSVEDLDV